MSQSWPEAEDAVCTSTSSAEPSTSDTQSLDSGPTPAKKTKVASKWQEDWKHYNMKWVLHMFTVTCVWRTFLLLLVVSMA